MLIQDRVKLIMKSGNLSASDFADKVDVKRSNLSHILSGRNKPSLDFLEKVINAYPNVNAAWLITGETREGSFEGVEKATKAPDSKELKETNVTSAKEIEKIVLMYTDGTFDALTPNER